MSRDLIFRTIIPAAAAKRKKRKKIVSDFLSLSF
jgi:hypothetical protein